MKKRVINTVDLFCGAGGAATGLSLALRDLGLTHKGLAINHWDVAVATMQANHANEFDTRKASIEAVIPAEVVQSGVLDLLWASPSCTHHSRAKGGKPRQNQLRAQPELILTWLDQLFVKRIIVENVPDILDWGPLDETGKPIKAAKGSCFRAWIDAIEARDYIVEWKILNCADYGDATTRRRFFLQAVRRGCGSIVWPEPSHHRRHRGIDTCIDWSNLGTRLSERKRPLSPNTMRRIIAGLKKYCGAPFQLDFLGTNLPEADCRLRPTSDPIPTQHASGNRTALAVPIVIDFLKHMPPRAITDPIGAQHTHDRFALASPVLIRLNNHCDGTPISQPIGAITAGGTHYGLATPIFVPQHTCGTCKPTTEPVSTIAAKGAIGLVTPIAAEYRIIDIHFRMLAPEELALAHSFPKDYILTGNKTERVKQIGNSVPVETARALCRAALAQTA